MEQIIEQLKRSHNNQERWNLLTSLAQALTAHEGDTYPDVLHNNWQEISLLLQHPLLHHHPHRNKIKAVFDTLRDNREREEQRAEESPDYQQINVHDSRLSVHQKVGQAYLDKHTVKASDINTETWLSDLDRTFTEMKKSLQTHPNYYDDETLHSYLEFLYEEEKTLFNTAQRHTSGVFSLYQLWQLTTTKGKLTVSPDEILDLLHESSHAYTGQKVKYYTGRDYTCHPGNEERLLTYIGRLAESLQPSSKTTYESLMDEYCAQCFVLLSNIDPYKMGATTITVNSTLTNYAQLEGMQYAKENPQKTEEEVLEHIMESISEILKPLEDNWLIYLPFGKNKTDVFATIQEGLKYLIDTDVEPDDAIEIELVDEETEAKTKITYDMAKSALQGSVDSIMTTYQEAFTKWPDSISPLLIFSQEELLSIYPNAEKKNCQGLSAKACFFLGATEDQIAAFAKKYSGDITREANNSETTGDTVFHYAARHSLSALKIMLQDNPCGLFIHNRQKITPLAFVIAQSPPELLAEILTMGNITTSTELEALLEQVFRIFNNKPMPPALFSELLKLKMMSIDVLNNVGVMHWLFMGNHHTLMEILLSHTLITEMAPGYFDAFGGFQYLMENRCSEKMLRVVLAAKVVTPDDFLLGIPVGAQQELTRPQLTRVDSPEKLAIIIGFFKDNDLKADCLNREGTYFFDKKEKGFYHYFGAQQKPETCVQLLKKIIELDFFDPSILWINDEKNCLDLFLEDHTLLKTLLDSGNKRLLTHYSGNMTLIQYAITNNQPALLEILLNSKAMSPDALCTPYSTTKAKSEEQSFALAFATRTNIPPITATMVQNNVPMLKTLLDSEYTTEDVLKNQYQQGVGYLLTEVLLFVDPNTAQNFLDHPKVTEKTLNLINDRSNNALHSVLLGDNESLNHDTLRLYLAHPKVSKEVLLYKHPQHEKTPLHYMAAFSPPDIINTFLDSNKVSTQDLTVEDEGGHNVFFASVQEGKVENIKTLLASPKITKEIVTSANASGETPLDFAKRSGLGEITMLIETYLTAPKASVSEQSLFSEKAPPDSNDTVKPAKRR